MLVVTIPPAVEPITLDQAKRQCRVTIDDDDDEFPDMIQTGRILCEAAIARSFIQTAWLWTQDGFPGQWRWYGNYRDPRALERPTGYTVEPLILPRAPIISIDSITYLNEQQERVTLDPSLYSYELADGCRIFPSGGTTWPSAYVQIGCVEIRFTAGYGTDPSTVPGPIKSAIKMAVSHLYNNREGEAVLPETITQVLASCDWGYYP